MTEKPLVSVVINCYNSEKYLRETIDSLIAQTYENWEAIFWDNCSTDKTADIIDSYKEPRFRYFLAEKNTPLGEARNLAMEKVKGEYFCFLDSDDVWMSTFLSTGVENLTGDETLVGFYSNFFNLIGNTKKLKNPSRISGRHNLKFMLVNYGIGMSGCIMRKKFQQVYNIHFDNEFQLVEDMDFYLAILEYGDFVYESTPLFYYRIYPENTSNKLESQWSDEYNHLYIKLYNKYIKTCTVGVSVKDLENIKIREVSYRMGDCIRNNKRYELFKLLIHNRYMPFRYIRTRIVFLLFGNRIYEIIKSLSKK